MRKILAVDQLADRLDAISDLLIFASRDKNLDDDKLNILTILLDRAKFIDDFSATVSGDELRKTTHLSQKIVFSGLNSLLEHGYISLDKTYHQVNDGSLEDTYFMKFPNQND